MRLQVGLIVEFGVSTYVIDHSKVEAYIFFLYNDVLSASKRLFLHPCGFGRYIFRGKSILIMPREEPRHFELTSLVLVYSVGVLLFTPFVHSLDFHPSSFTLCACALDVIVRLTFFCSACHISR